MLILNMECSLSLIHTIIKKDLKASHKIHYNKIYSKIKIKNIMKTKICRKLNKIIIIGQSVRKMTLVKLRISKIVLDKRNRIYKMDQIESNF